MTGWVKLVWLFHTTTYLYDSKFKEENFNMTRDIVSQLQDLQEQDVAKNKIVSDGK